ncbi:MAG TPA: hypothetical protein VJ835_12535 [Fimbriimonadaceae bacterium]|nr:hypothetical protein [Fimbriimonadaceae bacterium]
MSESQKKLILIVVVVLAVGAAAFSAFNFASGPKEEIVGTLPMAEGGGRDAERGKSTTVPADPSQAVDPSGMPASVLQNGK